MRTERPPYPASPLRWSVGLVGLAAIAWALVKLPLAVATGAVALAGAGTLLILRFPWTVWPVLALVLAVTSAVRIGGATR